MDKIDEDKMKFHGIPVSIIRKALQEAIDEWLEKHKDDEYIASSE